MLLCCFKSWKKKYVWFILFYFLILCPNLIKIANVQFSVIHLLQCLNKIVHLKMNALLSVMRPHVISERFFPSLLFCIKVIVKVQNWRKPPTKVVYGFVHYVLLQQYYSVDYEKVLGDNLTNILREIMCVCDIMILWLWDDVYFLFTWRLEGASSLLTATYDFQTIQWKQKAI